MKGWIPALCLGKWKYVGYSQVSHATSEFDVTEVLKNGENTLAVLVLNGVMELIWKIRINFE